LGGAFKKYQKHEKNITKKQSAITGCKEILYDVIAKTI
jgi:hypothetical protein